MRSRVLVLVSLLALSFCITGVGAAPSGASIVSNTTEEAPVEAADSLKTAGGTFTTLLLNGTGQTEAWKAYVGNVTGKLTLQDANEYSIYDWTLSTISGEVFATRNDSIDWGNVECANRTTIEQTDTDLNVSSSEEISINRTFNESVHESFFVGGTQIQQSTCPAIATYVNDSAQEQDTNASFQEPLLQDDSDLIYTTLLEEDAPSYHPNKTFDFQMIVPENRRNSANERYYFYTELT